MELNIDEALRYLGAGRQAPPELRREAGDTARRLAARLQPRYTYRVFSLERKDGLNINEAVQKELTAVRDDLKMDFKFPWE